MKKIMTKGLVSTVFKNIIKFATGIKGLCERYRLTVQLLYSSNLFHSLY